MVRNFSTPASLCLVLLLASFGLTACGGGGGGGSSKVIDSGASTVSATPSFGAFADGVDEVTITATLFFTNGSLASNFDVAIAVDGNSNTLTQLVTRTDSNGVATATLSTTIAEEKTVTVTAGTGADAVVLDGKPAINFIWPSAQSHYVRTTGSDANSGDSPIRAWATIGFAATQVVPGDTVFVGAGTYNESVTITRSGTSDDDVVFFGDRTGVFTGDSGKVLVNAGGADHAIDINAAEHVVLNGINATGATPGVNGGGGIAVTNGANEIAILNSEVYNNDRGLWIDSATTVTIECLTATNNTGGDGDGVSIGASSSVGLRAARIYNNARYGVHLRDMVTNFDLNVSTLYLNGDDQVHEDGSGSTGLVHNSIVSMGLADGLDFVSGTSLTQDNVNFDANAGNAFSIGGVAQVLSNASFEADPLFVDPDGSDNLLGGANATDDLLTVDNMSPTIDLGDDEARNIQLSFGAGALSGSTTRDDGVLDGMAPDGDMVNLGHHVRQQSDPLGRISTGDGRLFFGSGNDVQVFGRAWDNGTTTWLPSTLADPAVATVKWVRNVVSPINSREELLAIFSDSGSETELSVRLWNGLFWSEAGGTQPIESQVLSANADQRGFDIAYEHLSGQGMVVYSDNTNNPLYRTHTFGVWSDEAPVFTTSPGTGSVLWVELASTGSSNEIAMVALTDTQNLIACIWNGSSWDQSTATLLDNSIAVLLESRGFDVAYEQSSGDLLVCWGKSLVDEQLDYAVLPSGQSTFTFDVATSIDAVGGIVRLASEPGSDRIALGVSEGIVSNQDAIAGVWDGTDFTELLEVALNTGAADARDCAVSWVGTTGIAVFVWKGDDGGGALDWARFQSTGWQLMPDEPFAGIGDMEFIQAVSFPNADQLMILYSDGTNSLYGMTYDTNTWTFTNGGLPLESNLSVLGQSAQPFSFSFKP